MDSFFLRQLYILYTTYAFWDACKVLVTGTTDNTIKKMLLTDSVCKYKKKMSLCDWNNPKMLLRPKHLDFA